MKIQKCVALFDYSGTTQRELSFRKGDIITVQTMLNSGWWIGEISGAVGMFPGNYVQLMPAEVVEEKPIKIRTATADSLIHRLQKECGLSGELSEQRKMTEERKQQIGSKIQELQSQMQATLSKNMILQQQKTSMPQLAAVKAPPATPGSSTNDLTSSSNQSLSTSSSSTSLTSDSSSSTPTTTASASTTTSESSADNKAPGALVHVVKTRPMGPPGRRTISRNLTARGTATLRANASDTDAPSSATATPPKSEQATATTAAATTAATSEAVSTKQPVVAPPSTAAPTPSTKQASSTDLGSASKQASSTDVAASVSADSSSKKKRDKSKHDIERSGSGLNVSSGSNSSSGSGTSSDVVLTKEEKRNLRKSLKKQKDSPSSTDLSASLPTSAEEKALRRKSRRIDREESDKKKDELDELERKARRASRRMSRAVSESAASDSEGASESEASDSEDGSSRSSGSKRYKQEHKLRVALEASLAAAKQDHITEKERADKLAQRLDVAEKQIAESGERERQAIDAKRQLEKDASEKLKLSTSSSRKVAHH